MPQGSSGKGVFCRGWAECIQKRGDLRTAWSGKMLTAYQTEPINTLSCARMLVCVAWRPTQNHFCSAR